MEKKSQIEDAKERQVYNSLQKNFNFSKSYVTDIKENSKVNLPKPVNAKIQGEIEMIRNILMEEFRKYRNEIEEENKKERDKRSMKESTKTVEKEIRKKGIKK